MARMSRVLDGLGVLALSLALLAPVPAYADGPDRSGRAARAVQSVTFSGHGWGHGHGLSQYGAKSRAQAGQDHGQILGFYYPGTETGTARGRIRVLVTADTTRDVVVLDRPGLTVHSLGNGKTWRPRVEAKKWRIRSAPGGRSAISYRTGRWHAWRTVPGDAELGARGKPLTLVTPSGRVAYRGVLRSATPVDGGRERDTVNVLRLDGYLKGVVPQEVPAQWPAEAVRAQAVAARTYAAYERADVPASRWFDVWDTTRSQVYGGFSAEQPESNDAVAATAGDVRTWQGDLAFTQFARSNGGFTAQGQVHGEDVPYLPARKDEFDTQDDDWSATFTADEITQHWTGLGDLESVTVERDANGAWADTVTVNGSESSVTVAGERFMSFLGLRSYFLDDPQAG